MGVDQLVMVVCLLVMIHALECCAVLGGDVRAPTVRDHMTYPARQQTSDHPGPSQRRTGVVVGVIVAVLVVIVATVGAYLKLSGGGDELEAAKRECSPKSSAVTVSDGGKTLVLSLPAAGAGGQLLGCVLDTLHAPVAIRQRIGAAKGVEGRQTGEWDRYKVAWSASGTVLSVTIEFA
jgi:hypothetical protein